MKVNLLSLDGEVKEQVDLPEVFEEDLRPDIIKRAVLSAQSSRIQPKGSNPRAGMETTAETPPKGSGNTRVRRIKGQGFSAAGRGAWSPSTTGGRAAHPLKSDENPRESINRKENNLAIRSLISATKDRKLVSSRGHVLNGVDSLPIIVVNDFESIEKTREVKEVLEKLGVWGDVQRVKKGRKIRAGKGKSRKRRYKRKIGPLIVVDEDRGIIRGSRNIPGIDVSLLSELNAELMAPGGTPARLTIWTDSSMNGMKEVFD